jgi:hypothetical protein
MIKRGGIIEEEREKDANSQQYQWYHTRAFNSSNVPHGNEFQRTLFPVSYPA